ncbi:uncharacterized protein A4U43_C05F10260 [Asparagus officinalis]|uniref:Uncharacterized protein n=1 Tax=Asparagus officinalis TaxID=4686 RepID=A0A5P1ET89_ASPOF|nr:uncharacterized protein A4U43_C05F10260 [Asparagus officinalis]
MMKSDYEVRNGALGLIQPNDIPWDCGPMGLQIPQDSLARAVGPVVLGGNCTGSDFSEFMDLVAQHISNMSPDSTIDEFSVDNSTISTDKTFPPPFAQTEYYRPHKAPRRDRMSDISTRLVPEHAKVATTKPANEHEEQALSMITTLLECAVAISIDNLPDANRMLLELTQLASPYSPSCAERVIAYFTHAMLSRVMSSRLSIYWATMRLIEALRPNAITLVEQEMIRTGSFLDRFVGSLHYYSTLFDSLGASLPVDNPSRYRVENGLLAREIGNILAIRRNSRVGGWNWAEGPRSLSCP